MDSMKNIRNMSEDELIAKAFRNLALFFAVKWGLIFGAKYLAKKLIKTLPDK